ncbi:Nucleotidyl transferase (plasmid) [Methanohalobium evestigatum Z-7303]|uniref:UTP--glucose-1-phosphate uridylyltransferase n=1 Tax=Methanohalobium evestigatum (strain ATCC BAA-1072 / DSM 3721 / NBRC 107634 / OCM 161 / Z-7303) TaxID=644295 RepID=D7EBY7_METEZ|nr:sugar phosphate nucleotidyltransferase [Methanohalobium evestigatum]ADI75109.1 Nucleotidyl transferase [Methanohalobium evestigatum Z-7303]
MKGLIPAAGSGTRLGPFTHAMPKELLPVGDKAVIEHVVESFVKAGIDDIIIVVSPNKHGLSDYFGSGERFGVDITYVVQDDRLGLANAVAAGEHVVNGSPVAVVLGDNFFSPDTILQDLKQFHEDNNADATVGVMEVLDVTRHGIIQTDGNNIVDLIEKPEVGEAPSKLGIAGMYVFEPEIFDAISDTKPGYKDEYQLTDSIKVMVEQGKNVVYREIGGIHIDVGTPEDLMKANEYYLKNNNKTKK